MRPQKPHHISVEQAIDHVAARLTHPDDDPMLATRIITTLPDRVSWFGWLFNSWAPRLAVLAIIATAGILWSNTPATPVERAPLQAAATLPALTTFAPVVEPEPNRTKPLEPGEALEHLEPARPSKSDFDRSLAALEVESLEIADLPMTEPIFPR